MNCRKQDEFIALKVYVNSFANPPELEILQHLKSMRSEHPGRLYVRQMLDSFEIAGPDGKHTCLVHEPLGINFT